MKHLMKLFLLALLATVSSCSKNDKVPEANLDLSQYRLVYTYRARTWQAEKDHIAPGYVDFLNATQAESWGSSTFNYTVNGNKVSFTYPSGVTCTFDVNPATKEVTHLTSDNSNILEYQIQKLQKKDNSQSILNKTYSGFYNDNQETGNIFHSINFKFSDTRFVKYGLVLGTEPEPLYEATFYAGNTAFWAGNLPTSEILSGVLIDGKLYLHWTVSTSPYAFWGTLTEN